MPATVTICYTPVPCRCSAACMLTAVRLLLSAQPTVGARATECAVVTL